MPVATKSGTAKVKKVKTSHKNKDSDIEQKSSSLISKADGTTSESANEKSLCRIVTGSYEHTLSCLSLEEFKTTKTFREIFHFTPHTQSIRCLARCKRYLVSGSNDENIRLYDLQKRKELGTLMHHKGSISSLKFFSTKWLISSAEDGVICVWRTKDWEVLGELKGHKSAINDLDIHPSGRVALSVGSDRTIRLWNLMTCRKASLLKVRENPLKARWSQDGSRFLIAFKRKILIYDSEHAKSVAEISFDSGIQHMELVQNSPGFSSDAEVIITSHDDGSIQFRVLSDTELKATPIVLQGHSSRVKHFALHNTLLTSVSSDGRIVVWNLEDRSQIAVYDTGERLNCCIVLPPDIEGIRSNGDTEDTFSIHQSENESDMSDVEANLDMSQEEDMPHEDAAPSDVHVTVEFE